MKVGAITSRAIRSLPQERQDDFRALMARADDMKRAP
jgi:hypothetical protein